MLDRKSLFYTFKFAFITIISCILVLIIGLYLGNYLKSKNEKSTVTSVGDDTLTFVIDAGHGGEDAGAIANDGTLEKDLNFEIATLVACILELNGNDVKMTRDSDTLLYDYYGDLKDYTGQKKVYDLKNRVKFTAEFENPIYVGIHMNKFSIEKYKGLQVYYSANDQGSVGIANKIKDNTRLYLQPYNKREVKKANSSIYILNNIDCPAVLVECGFLSNEDDLNNLKNGDYQMKLSLVLFCSLLESVQ